MHRQPERLCQAPLGERVAGGQEPVEGKGKPLLFLGERRERVQQLLGHGVERWCGALGRCQVPFGA